MAESIECPYCQTRNEEELTFCINCGRPLKGKSTLVLGGQQNMESTKGKDALDYEHEETAHLPRKMSFLPRPDKAVFGDRFLGHNLLLSDEQKHVYSVTEIGTGEKVGIKLCSNPDCGAVHVPVNNQSEIFCTRCGSNLSNTPPNFILIESRMPILGSVDMLPEMSLIHSGIRVPVAVFKERVSGDDRFCFVKPETNPITETTERDQVYRWGVTLASAFEYLHQNGLTFDGQFNKDIFHKTNGNVVIAEFDAIRVSQKVGEDQRIADFRSLSKVIFYLLTGEEKYHRGFDLTPELDNFFNTAIHKSSFLSGSEFIQAFTKAQQLVVDTSPIEHKLGRITDVGMVRSLNEDSLLTIQMDKYLASQPDPLGIYVVADGMGGHSAGEVASGAIVNTITEVVFSDRLLNINSWTPEEYQKWIDSIIQKANKDVYDIGRRLNSDMGSTIVMALVYGNNVCLGHVGDSRAYQINQDGITRLTSDHSLVERLIKEGQISRQEARNHPQRNVIYRTIGDNERVDVETLFCHMNRGDRLLLCSDGLNGMLEDEVIRQIVFDQGLSPQAACNNLVNAANQAGGEDNITVVILEFL